MNTLLEEYRLRFEKNANYRNEVWKVIVDKYLGKKHIVSWDIVLDIGCGWGEFINNVVCKKKYAMDLNPDTKNKVNSDVELLLQDCSQEWSLKANSLDVVFSSNFFEHLPDKAALGRTLDEAFRCLKPGGRIICMGPNIKCVPGAYWDFWDHYLPLTELSLKEGMELSGFQVPVCKEKFMPYSMSQGFNPPLFLIGIYLSFPLFWKISGKQFLVVGRKPTQDYNWV